MARVFQDRLSDRAQPCSRMQIGLNPETSAVPATETRYLTLCKTDTLCAATAAIMPFDAIIMAIAATR